MKYKKGYKYRLVDTYSIVTKLKPIHIVTSDLLFLNEFTNLTISPGYAWGGCSGPTWDDKTNMRAGLVHDALYQLIRNDVIGLQCRPYVDNLFYELLLEDGMCKLRANYYYYAVRLFGKKSTSVKKKVYEQHQGTISIF